MLFVSSGTAQLHGQYGVQLGGAGSVILHGFWKGISWKEILTEGFFETAGGFCCYVIGDIHCDTEEKMIQQATFMNDVQIDKARKECELVICPYNEKN